MRRARQLLGIPLPFQQMPRVYELEGPQTLRTPQPMSGQTGSLFWMSVFSNHSQTGIGLLSGTGVGGSVTLGTVLG